MDFIADKNERVSCPFNSAHVVQRARLQTHIIKCKRTLPDDHDFVQCQFWALHYVKKDKLDEHYATCQHALMKEANKRTFSTGVSKFKEPKLIDNSSVPSNYDDDSWDTPADQPVFKPELLSARSSTMVIPQGLSKSQRKEYQEKERQRIRELEQSKKQAQPDISWDSEPPLQYLADNPDFKPRKPNTPALVAALPSSTGSSHEESFEAESSASRSTFESFHSMAVRQSGPAGPSMPVRAAPYYVPRPANRGRGQFLMSSWDSDTRPPGPSHYPHPYDSIPYRYSQDDFPAL